MSAESRSLPYGLQTAHDQARHEIERADAKAAVLLTLVGLVLAGVVALAARPAGPAAVVLWCSAAPITASVLLLLLAVRPRLTRSPAPGTWLWAARVGPTTLVESSVDGEGAPWAAACDVCLLARIAHAKYVRIRVAVDLLIGGLVVLGAALVIAVVTS